MALKIYDTMVPQGDYPAVKAEHVGMADGTKLDDLLAAANLKAAEMERAIEDLENQGDAYPVAAGAAELQPETYYCFGEVSALAVTLAAVEDGLAHEYCFEFIPKAGFTGLTISPEVRWGYEPQYPAGKTCQVSILRGVAVMICA